MAKKMFVGFLVAIVIAISGDLPVAANDLEKFGSLFAGLLNGALSRKQSDGYYKSAKESNKADAAQSKEYAYSAFLARDAVARQVDLQTQDDQFFLETFGRSRAYVIATHNGLCGRKPADAEFVVNEGDSLTTGKAMTVAEVEANLASKHILLQSHLRGAGDKEGWQPALLNDEPSKFDGCIVIVDHLPAKIEVVGDVAGLRVNVAWYKAKKYVQNPDGSYQMNPDGSYFLADKSKEELDKEVVQKGQYYYFLPLGYDIPAGASRLSLAVSIWNKNPDAEKPDEVANFLLLKADTTAPRQAGGTRVSIVPSIRRGVTATAVAMSSSLVDGLCGGKSAIVSDIQLAMLPAS